jgi:hypothetical protein
MQGGIWYHNSVKINIYNNSVFPLIRKDEMCLNVINLLCSYAAPMAYQNVIRTAVPLTFLR